jgi:hypothetical protein
MEREYSTVGEPGSPAKSANVITQNQIPWDKCVVFYVDNASVIKGKRNSI